jgi:hypothetical protein
MKVTFVELLLKIDQVQLLTFQKCLCKLQTAALLTFRKLHPAYDTEACCLRRDENGEEEGYHGVHEKKKL